MEETPEELAPELAAIAKKYFGTASLDTRNSDALDFRDLAVWNLRAALEAAYDAGRQSKEKAPDGA